MRGLARARLLRHCVRTSFGRASQAKGSSSSGQGKGSSSQPPSPPVLLNGQATVVPWLIGTNCAIFGLWDVGPLRAWMHDHFALSVESMRSGRYHTILTSCFSHVAGAHLGGNMLMLWLFGRELPAALGARSFLGLYFGGALTASSAWLVQQQSLLSRSRYHANSGRVYHTASLGASGPVNAVIITSCLLAPRRTVLLFFVIPMPAGLLAAVFLANDAWGMAQGPESSIIAHSAHLGGALFGAVWVGLRTFLR